MNDRPSATPATGKKTLWAWAIGTFFGVGLLKPGPGTWGSVAAVLLWSLTTMLPAHHAAAAGVGAVVSIAPLLFGIILATGIGIPAATIVARESGREDPGHVVIDEVAGQWLTLAVCRPDWPHALLALALFRLFDITKPWPIRKLEALPGGWGIMLDDLAAGLFGLIVLLVIQHWW
ncbi:MAG TPA: phosphatidylglycerophosphatase A [Acidobacteriaceae bacterium]|jgi:phosphatidylglycerophosphatase A|nr:phosphatidylglycerophosphatase A [Acidobacteriaceae bacterium]